MCFRGGDVVVCKLCTFADVVVCKLVDLPADETRQLRSLPQVRPVQGMHHGRYGGEGGALLN